MTTLISDQMMVSYQKMWNISGFLLTRGGLVDYWNYSNTSLDVLI